MHAEAAAVRACSAIGNHATHLLQRLALLEPVKTTIEWEDEGTSGGGEERSGEGEEGEATSSEDFGGGDGEYEEDFAERGQEQRQEQQQRKKRFWTGRRLLIGDDIEP